MKKRVLMLLQNSFLPDPRVYKESITLINNEFDVDIYCLDRNRIGKNEEIDGINIFRIDVGKRIPNSAINYYFRIKLFEFKVLKLFKDNNKNYDIIHVNDFETLNLGIKLKKKLSIPLIFDVHELTFGYRDYKLKYLTNLIINRIVKKNLNFIDFFIITSYERLILFSAKYNIKIQKIEVINNYPFQQKDFQKIKNKKYIFQYQGKIHEKRNILNIVKAVNCLPDNLKSRIEIRIYGDYNNKYGDKIIEYIKENNLEDYISFYGFINKKKLDFETKKTDIGLIPLRLSNLNNIFPAPNKIFDYISKKNLVLCQNTYGIAKKVRSDKLGFLCSFSDIEDIKKKIMNILNYDHEYINSLQDLVFSKHIKKYRWESQKFIKIYKTLTYFNQNSK